MKVIHLDNDGHRKVFQIEIPWLEIVPDYDDIVLEYAKISLPGFRPGKSPLSVVEQRFQKQIIDVLFSRAAYRFGKEAIREAGVEAMGSIEIGDMGCEKGKPFQFTIRFWPMPAIELPYLGSLYIQKDGLDPRDTISYRLLEMVSFPVPDELVLAELGLESSSIVAHESAEWKAATDRVRLMVILKRIADREGIEASEGDVQRRIEEKATEFDSHPATLRTELEEGGGIHRLKDMLLAESTLAYLIEKSGRAE